MTIEHALTVWNDREITLYVGCYRNDPATIAAVTDRIDGNDRLRLVVHPVDGPTSKADCLNRLYVTMIEDEVATGEPYHMVVLHDAEDMVDASALQVMGRALRDAEFVQLPVLALPQRRSRWVAGHYTDEFAEAHGKTMVVRDRLGAGIPGAGVGCAIARDMLHRLAMHSDERLPFATESLTEDYELGLDVALLGGRTRFVRQHAADGALIATRAFFPARLDEAVRQKTRWIHGIAMQSWDRLGWRGDMICLWMQLRDRRGPFAALLLAVGYALIAMNVFVWGLAKAGWATHVTFDPALTMLLWVNAGFLVWRAIVRAIFTGRAFGPREGLRAIVRIPVSNIIAIMATRRAVAAYWRSLRGASIAWDKTTHHDHPAIAGIGTAALR